MSFLNTCMVWNLELNMRLRDCYPTYILLDWVSYNSPYMKHKWLSGWTHTLSTCTQWYKKLFCYGYEKQRNQCLQDLLEVGDTHILKSDGKRSELRKRKLNDLLNCECHGVNGIPFIPGLLCNRTQIHSYLTLPGFIFSAHWT